VERVTDAEADEYFATRAAQSRISAIASDQSRPLPDRAAFEQRIAELSEIYGDGPDIPRPEILGRLPPDAGRDRVLAGPGLPHRTTGCGSRARATAWETGRLYP
jgi:pyridoxamine 5'-phosphate oxidase